MPKPQQAHPKSKRRSPSPMRDLKSGSQDIVDFEPNVRVVLAHIDAVIDGQPHAPSAATKEATLYLTRMSSKDNIAKLKAAKVSQESIDHMLEVMENYRFINLKKGGVHQYEFLEERFEHENAKPYPKYIVDKILARERQPSKPETANKRQASVSQFAHERTTTETSPAKSPQVAKKVEADKNASKSAASREALQKTTSEKAKVSHKNNRR